MAVVDAALLLSMSRVFGRVHVQNETVLVLLFDQGIRPTQNSVTHSGVFAKAAEDEAVFFNIQDLVFEYNHIYQ